MVWKPAERRVLGDRSPSVHVERAVSAECESDRTGRPEGAAHDVEPAVWRRGGVAGKLRYHRPHQIAVAFDSNGPGAHGEALDYDRSLHGTELHGLARRQDWGVSPFPECGPGRG